MPMPTAARRGVALRRAAGWPNIAQSLGPPNPPLLLEAAFSVPWGQPRAAPQGPVRAP